MTYGRDENKTSKGSFEFLLSDGNICVYIGIGVFKRRIPDSRARPAFLLVNCNSGINNVKSMNKND
jgi:hypothetical protein